MAGSIVVTTSKVAGSGGVTKHSIAWTSDAAGAVSGNTMSMPPGSIVAVEFIPGSGGTQPTNAYDVDFLDAEGVSMFSDGAATPASIGLDLSNAAAAHRVPFIHGAAGSTYVRAWLQGGSGYQPTVAAAGNAKTGTIEIYVTPAVL
jgi:hypothetical protein